MTPIIRYLIENELPKNHLEAQRLVSKAARFAMISKILHRRSFAGP